MNTIVTLQERQRLVTALSREQKPLLPPSIDEAVDGKISLSDLKNGLTFRITYVLGMEVGGYYHVILQSAPEGSASEGAGFGLGGYIEVEGKDIIVHVPPDRALAFQGLKMDAYYFMTDYEKPTSPVISLSVGAEIYTPIIDEAVDGIIPASTLNKGVNLRIRHASSITPDSVVSIYCVSSNSRACFVKYINVELADIGKDLIVAIEPDFLGRIAYGEIHVIYTVHSSHGTWTSPLLTLAVSGDLKIPEAEHVDKGFCVPSTLLPVDESGMIPMALPTEGMNQDDHATLIFYGGKRSTDFISTRQVTAAEITEGKMRFFIPTPFSALSRKMTVMGVLQSQAGSTVCTPVLRLTRV